MFKNLFKKKPMIAPVETLFEKEERLRKKNNEDFDKLPMFRITRNEIVGPDEKIVESRFQVERKSIQFVPYCLYIFEKSFDNIEDARKEKERLEYASASKLVTTVVDELPLKS